MTPEPQPVEALTPRELNAFHADLDTVTLGARGEGEEGDATRPSPVAFNRIIAAVNGDDASGHVIPWAVDLARRSGAKVWVITVTSAVISPPYYPMSTGLGDTEMFLEEARAHAERVTGDAARMLKDAGVDVETAILTGSPVRAITEFTDTQNADLVIVGSHARGRFGRLFLGSVASGVKNHVPASVLIARSPPAPERVLAAVDGSRASRRAAETATRFARSWGAHTRVLHVVEPFWTRADEDAGKAVDAARDTMRFTWPGDDVAFTVDVGAPAERVVERAEAEERDLVVVGSRGLSGFRTLVAGSVSARIAHAFPRSVLVVKGT
jgi:nucleotide-binding universal stress UspA family protein